MLPRRLLPRRQIRPPQGKNDETGKIIRDYLDCAGTLICDFASSGGAKCSCKERCAQGKGGFLESGNALVGTEFGPCP
jgi:hypothetical protein